MTGKQEMIEMARSEEWEGGDYAHLEAPLFPGRFYPYSVVKGSLNKHLRY